MAENRQVSILDDRVRLALSLANDLSQPVGTGAGAFELPVPAVSTGELAFFDRTVGLSASLTPRLAIAARGDQVDGLYGEGSALAAPAGSRLAELSLDAVAGLGMQQNVKYGQATVSAQASAGGKVAYRQLVPVAEQDSRLDAFLALAKASRLPQAVAIRAVPAGTASRLEALFYLDLGLTAQVGQDFEVSLAKEVFEGLPAVFEVKGTASARAALGLGLYERLAVTSGRGDLSSTRPDWVRLRVERESRRRLSFGVVVELQAKYDLGSSLSTILGKAFDQIPPLPRAVAAFAEVNRLVAEGDWATVQERLYEELADTLSEWLDGTGWKEWAAGSQQVARLLEISGEIVAAYQELGPRLQSLWDELLGAVDLGAGAPLRRRLEQLAALDPDAIDLGALVADRLTALGDSVDLLETLSGRTLEDILLEPDGEAREALRQVAGQAARALAFLDGTPKRALEALQGFAERTGVAGTIAFLAENATSLDAVEGYVSQRVRALAARWVGKAAGELNAAERKKVERVAKRIQALLDAPEALEKKLRAAVEKLRGEIGFSLSLEIDRVTQTQALIDVEIDPAPAHQRLHREVEKELAAGSVAGILQALDRELGTIEEGEIAAGRDLDLPFVLRQCSFQSRHLRTSAASTMLRITGLGRLFQDNRRTTRERLRESELTVEQTNGGARRVGSYTGAYVHTESVNKVTDRTAYRLLAADAGRGFDPTRRFDEARAQSLAFQVAFFHEDLAIHTGELRGIDALLVDLGFFAGDSAFQGLPLTDQTRLRLTVNLRFPAAAVDAFLDLPPESEWNASSLQAARRWFDERSVWVPFQESSKVSQGEVLDAISRSDAFLAKWTVGSRDLAKAIGSRGLDIRIGQKTRTIEVVRPAGGGEFVYLPPYHPLKVLIDRRGRGLRRQRKVAAALAEARQKRTDAAYQALIAAAAKGWAGTVAASNSWPSTLHGLWLVLARLTAAAPARLADVTGVASLRWKEPEAESWSGPRGWRLSGGVRQLVTP